MATLGSIKTWDDEADIVIVGCGLSGTVAAITTFDTNPDTDVLIIEKNPAGLEGGNSRASGQSLWCPEVEDLELVKDYQRSLSHPNPPPEELLHSWAEGMVSLEPWLIQMAEEAGHKYVRENRASDVVELIVEFEELPGSESVRFNSTITPNPSGVWNTFKFHLDKRRPNIRLKNDTKILDLIQDGDSLEVFGIIAEKEGKRLAIKARKAVIMATGSFDNNLEMQRDYWGADRIYHLGNPANTGEGVKILQKAGADMWHMRNFNQSGGLWPSMKFPEFEAAFFKSIRWKAWSWLEIGADGKRFYNEAEQYSLTHYRQKINNVWRDTPHNWVLPVHNIFDESMRLSGPLTTEWMSWNTVVLGYKWSPDNSVEIDKGWIKKADSIRELAEIISRDPASLEAEVQKYNRYAKLGLDEDFGRSAERMAPIVKPPFYAVEIVPAIVAHTAGGKRNVKSQVMDIYGRPIPRLFEVGEMGSIVANIYQNGTFLTECMISGRIAAREALSLDSWESQD
ncbi:MAG: FAD-binding protein [Bacteroidota bacterium]